MAWKAHKKTQEDNIFGDELESKTKEIKVIRKFDLKVQKMGIFNFELGDKLGQ